jgi:FkbM family methyltransferase
VAFAWPGALGMSLPHAMLGAATAVDSAVAVAYLISQVGMAQIKHSSAFKKTKRFLKQLIGKDVWLSPQVKCERLRFGDWCINPAGIDSDSIVYSLGVGEDVEFDQGMIEGFGVTVHAFDPTPNSINWVRDQVNLERFDFHPYGISNVDDRVRIFPRVNRKGRKSTSMFTVADQGIPGDGIEVQMHRLKTVMEKLGHDRIDILKMDVEAAEYDVIEDVVASGLDIGQILIEFHHRFENVGNAKTLRAVKALNDVGYRIFFISELGREYSFIRRRD